jgi:rhamnose transport system permease protein
VLLGTSAWVMSNIALGRAVYATGSNETAARLAGLDTARIKFMVFIVAGALTGLAALLNSVRFNQIPSNAGIGLEMKVIAAAVVGGAAIRGGSGSLVGTLLGVVLLGAIGPALTFLGVSAYWERALQGAIILAAVAVDAVRERRAVHSAVATAGAA